MTKSYQNFIAQKKHLVVNVQPIKNSTNAIIQSRAIVATNDAIYDDPIYVKNSNNVETHRLYLSDDSYIEFFRCSVIDSYLMTHNTIPILYGVLMYVDKITSGKAVTFFLNFEIKSKINSPSELIGTEILGEYSLHILFENITDPTIMIIDKFVSEGEIIDTILLECNKDNIKSHVNTTIKFAQKKRQDTNTFKTYIPKPTYKFDQLLSEYRQNGKINTKPCV
jgi:hypothetical protein